jgi:hypothetical protein
VDATVPQGSRPAQWIGLLCGLAFAGLSLVDLGAQVVYSWSGTAATGRVIEFHQASARSMTVYGTVEVAPGGSRPFRWDVDDTFGQASWSEGGSVPLLCAHLHADHVSCTLDSLVDRFAVALFFAFVGGGVAALSIRALRRPMAATVAGPAAR